MAKLYWRIKRAGKWTWTPATKANTIVEDEEYLDSGDWNQICNFTYVKCTEEEE